MECQGVTQNSLTKVVDSEYITDLSPSVYLSPSEIGWLNQIKDRIIKEEMDDKDEIVEWVG